MIEAANRADIPELSELFADIFVDDDTLGWLVHKARDPRAELVKGFQILLGEYYLPLGIIDIVRGADGTIQAGAAWMKPEVEMPRRVRYRMLAWVMSTGRARMDIYRYIRESGHVSLPFPHWYLFTIAVSDKARGSGVGSRLLTAGLERCGDQAVQLEATTARSAGLYARHGFITLGEAPTHAPQPEFIMWKPAQSGAQ